MITYDVATKQLQHQVEKMTLPQGFKPLHDMGKTVYRFRQAFQNPDIRIKTISQKYEQTRVAQGRYSAGFCGIASYTWNHLFRMPDGSEVWRMKMISNDMGYKLNHVWLENVFTGEPLDLTFDQFIDAHGRCLELPYSEIGEYVSSDFLFQRACVFAKHLGIQLDGIVVENALHLIARGR